MICHGLAEDQATLQTLQAPALDADRRSRRTPLPGLPGFHVTAAFLATV